MALQRLQNDQIQSVLERARQSPRLRANWNLHQPQDTLQRMINAMLRGTYCQPHQHAQPDKLEIFTILQGEAAVLAFSPKGDLIDCAHLNAQGPTRQVEIAPRTWHTVMVLSSEAIFYEVIEGAYDPATHKKFAHFAPPENSVEAVAYLSDLTAKVRDRLGLSAED